MRLSWWVAVWPTHDAPRRYIAHQERGWLQGSLAAVRCDG
jgi:hypothetical protein